MSFRVSVDIGGTCTDVVVASDSGGLTLGKAMTTRQHPQDGLAESLADAARQLGLTGEEILASTDLFVYSTTRATNAILEGTTARTACWSPRASRTSWSSARAAGCTYDFSRPLPRAVHPAPPHLRGSPSGSSAEGDGRDAAGRGRRPRDACADLPAHGVEAVAVCLLWSIANPAHEERSPSSSPSSCRACRSRCRTGSTRSSASTAAPRARRSTPR